MFPISLVFPNSKTLELMPRKGYPLSCGHTGVRTELGFEPKFLFLQRSAVVFIGCLMQIIEEQRLAGVFGVPERGLPGICVPQSAGMS